jgi:SARP family transcriptional regulator, regulator of embCAB operon
LAIPRIYLTGALALEHGEHLIRERNFPGRQGRAVFAFLALRRHRAVHREELMNAVWPGEAGAQGDSGLDPILSKLRALFRAAGLADAAMRAGAGTVELQLPSSTWIDVEAAANALDEAEGALRRNDGAAWSLANIAATISARSFLPELEAPWIEARRNTLRAMQLRALHCLALVSAGNHEPRLAIQHASEMVQLDPFKETAYQLLMRLHAAAGDRAEALRVFARLRELLKDELGVSPSAQTEAVYLEILKAG